MILNLTILPPSRPSPSTSSPWLAACGALGLLDLATMLNCTEQGPRPPAGRRCGEWTRDGLHGYPFLYGQFFNVAANVLADMGEMCMASLS
mmetsp:Transcript_71206/g.141195  ORF Transcript_71206/g.141195 Transcript_71206/m.141195 type:complete len:91 (+) Transcript_71206:414-686(+)